LALEASPETEKKGSWALEASLEDDTWALEASTEDDEKDSRKARPSSCATLLKYCNIWNLSKHITKGVRVRCRG
jgi:hypothetical protein